MNSTALGAENRKKQEIVFISEAHEKFYYEKLKEIQYKDVYHEALCYCLGINADTRKNVDKIYDFKTGCVKTECLQEGWQTNGSVKVVRMAFNLYCDGTPSVDDYTDTEGTFDSYSWQLIENKQKFIGQIMTSKSPVRSCEDVDEAALSYAEVKALATGNPYIKQKMDLDIQVSKLKLMKANHTSQKYRLEDNITQHYPQQIAIFKERIEGFTADIDKYAKNKPEDKEQFSIQVGGKPYTDKKEAGTAIIAMCKEIKGINASADVGEYLGFKLNVTFDSFNNKFVMNVKGAMSHPMEVGSDPIGNITRINNVLEAMPTQLEEAQTKLSNVEHQLATAKTEVNKPFAQEAELSEKLERLAELNYLLNMDEKGDEAIGMDDEVAEPEKPHEDVKSVDKKGDEVADMPAKQSNLGKTVTDDKLSDLPAERTSLKEKLEAMKARVSGIPAGREIMDKGQRIETML